MSNYKGNPIKDLRGFLTDAEVKTLIDGALKFRDKVFLRLVYKTGARVSEITGDKSWYRISKENSELRVYEPAKVQDIDFKEGNIILNLLKRKQYPPPKHLVTLDKTTLQMLEAYILQEHLQPTDRLFPFTRERAFQIIREVGESVGITRVGSKDIHMHHLRHSNCVTWIRNNNTLEGLRKLQQRIGHANINTTAQYLQFGPEQQEETEDVFGKW